MKYLGNSNIEGNVLVGGSISAQTIYHQGLEIFSTIRNEINTSIQNGFIDGYIDITELKWEKGKDYEYVINVSGVSSGDFVLLRVSDGINSFLNICKNNYLGVGFSEVDNQIKIINKVSGWSFIPTGSRVYFKCLKNV
jgi:hypothetical protein